MCVGKTNHKESRSNRELAQFSEEQAALHQQYVLPHEIAEVAQLTDEGYQQARGSILSGRANADAAAAELEAQQGLRRGQGGLGAGNFGAVNLAEGRIAEGNQTARSGGVQDGYTTGQGMTMSDRLEALKTGQGHVRGVTSGLSSAARNEAYVQRAEDLGEQQVGQALGGLAIASGISGYTGWRRANDPSVAYEDLRPIGKGLRTVFGPSETTSNFNPAATHGPMSRDPNAFTLPSYGGGEIVGPTSMSPTSANTTNNLSHNGPSKWQSFTNWIN